MRVINNLLILTENGSEIFSLNKNEEEKSHIFSMLLSAMDSFAREIGDSKLTSLNFKNDKYSVLRKKTLLFVAKSEKKTRNKVILRELEEISDNFFDRYGEEYFKNFNGDIECCAGLEEDSKHFMPNELQKIVEGLGWD